MKWNCGEWSHFWCVEKSLRKAKKIFLVCSLLVLSGLLFSLLFVSTENAVVEQNLGMVTIDRQIIDWDKVDQGLSKLVLRAEQKAMVYAKAEVDAVFDKVESRLFPFLQRQHGFFAMQIRSAKHVVGGLLHYLFGTKSPQEIQNAAFMVSLMDRVIQPEQLNLNVERIFGETLQVYMDNVNDGISRLRLKYRIPDDVWKRHVNDLSSIYLRNSSRGFTPFTAKVLLTGSTVTFMSVAGTMAKNTTVKLCRTMTTSMKSFVPRFARNIVSKLTLRSGTKLLGTAATVGILGWELWEHRNFHKYVLPVIHQEMKSYLVLVKERILNDPVSGVCMTIKQWGAQLIAAVYDKQDHAEM